MDRRQNKLECKWLTEQPNRLLTHYQPVVEIVVRQFIARGFFRAEEQQEIQQEINLQLLEKKLGYMQRNFQGGVLLRTYFSKVVYNCCLELARRRPGRGEHLGLEALQASQSEELTPLQRLAIRDEVFRLEALLRVLAGKRKKAELNLKLLIRLVLAERDIEWCKSRPTAAVLQSFRQHFFQTYEDLSDQFIFAVAVELFNQMENKANNGDSLRRWVGHLVQNLIRKLNGHPPASTHTVESLKLLLLHYFRREELQ